MATRILKERIERPERKRTGANVKTLQEAVHTHNKLKPQERIIWRSLSDRDISRRMRHFLFLALHGGHRIGYYWKHFCPERMECTCCKITETLEHVLVKCSQPWVNLTWKIAQSAWPAAFGPWPEISFGSILGCSLMTFKSPEGEVLPGATRLFKILITECAHLIWKMRCETVIGEKPTPSNREVYNRVVATINTRLKRDLLMAKRRNLPARYASRHQISCTWQHVVTLPAGEDVDTLGQGESWMNNTGVLVAIEPLSKLDPAPTSVG
ncbi:hypothetical protein PQX77_010011 [Marasmius sp. AFHP31]|nr:hypothetical protein PQX77_010011 [Marasmius sp. AFHP31]